MFQAGWASGKIRSEIAVHLYTAPHPFRVRSGRTAPPIGQLYLVVFLWQALHLPLDVAASVVPVGKGLVTVGGSRADLSARRPFDTALRKKGRPPFDDRP